jgi:hypothetical protein
MSQSRICKEIIKLKTYEPDTQGTIILVSIKTCFMMGSLRLARQISLNAFGAGCIIHFEVAKEESPTKWTIIMESADCRE